MFEEATAGHAPRLVGGLFEREGEAGVDLAFVRSDDEGGDVRLEWIADSVDVQAERGYSWVSRHRRHGKPFVVGERGSHAGGRSGFRSGRIGDGDVAAEQLTQQRSPCGELVLSLGERRC